MKRIMVTGGRDYDDYSTMFQVLARLKEKYLEDIIVIQGGAKGADYLAATACKELGIHYAEVPALWGAFGKRAGPVRNAIMVSGLEPDLVLAFPGGRGTADAVHKATRAKIEVIDVDCEPSEGSV